MRFTELSNVTTKLRRETQDGGRPSYDTPLGLSSARFLPRKKYWHSLAKGRRIATSLGQSTVPASLNLPR